MEKIKNAKSVLLAVFAGIISMILVTNGLDFFGMVKWGAVFVGALAGLEAGFWVGAYDKMRSAHRYVFSYRLFTENRDIFAELGKIMSVWSSLMLTATMNIFVANQIIALDHNVYFPMELVALVWCVLQVLTFIICVTLYLNDGGTFYNNPLPKNMFDPGWSKLVIMMFVMPFVHVLFVPLVITAYVLFWVVALFVCFYRILRVLCWFSFEHSLAAITIGVLVGGAVGLAVGWNSAINMLMLSMECTVGCLVGGVVSLGVMFLGSRVRYLGVITTYSINVA